ncbi:MAG: ATP-dependent RNA helicase HrpA [Gammaproteobacteria bacterium]
MSATPNPNASAHVVALMQQMNRTMLSDRGRLVARIKRSPKLGSEPLEKLKQDIARSIARAESRAQRFSANVIQDLPIAEKADEIVESIRANQVTIVAGATGSGKTTQLPKLCLQAGFGSHGTIGHTQPRRIAARATCARIAEELGCPVGSGVGFKVRFNDQTGPECQVKVMTDGMLLQEAQRDRGLMEYDCLIIDEAHERSLNIDFLLGLLKRLLIKRPQLRVIITSATINPGEFAAFFNDAPIIEVSGRSYPIEVEYHDPGDRPMDQHICDTISTLWEQHTRGDVLVFLPGEREIRDTMKVLEGRFEKTIDVLPLYARLSSKEQSAVFRTSGKTRVVLSTNVAETSLTVPGIIFVVDTGTARISRYHYRSKLQRLAVEPVSQASSSQRAGRCGRTQPGVCARLFSEEDFDQRSAYTDPEIVRTNLASVILRMQVLGLGAIESFEFVQAPDRRFIKDGYRLLEQLQAFSKQGKVTKQGRRMARYPLDPRLAKVLVSAVDDGCLAEMQVIAAGLSAGDPRERPLDHQKAADEKHKVFIDKHSDFMSLINIWRAWRRLKGSQKQQRTWCRQNFLSFRRLQEWNDVVLQLRYVAKDLTHTVNKRPASPALIHTSLLRGFIDHIGQRETVHDYKGARGRQFKLFPGSGLAAKPPAWVMAAEIVETSQVFARQAAQINPAWVEKAGAHLVQRRCVEEFWNKQQGCAMALEEVGLFGFVLSRNRRVPLSRHDKKAARKAFIQHALVDNRWNFRAPFIDRNKKNRDALAVTESKLRQILLDEQQQFELFDQRVPETVFDRKSFVSWFNTDKENISQALTLTPEELGSVDEAKAVWFPDSLSVDGHTLNLEYVFDPSDSRDGVTLAIPAALVRYVKQSQVDWLVPGWLKLKTEALFRGLPKSKRKQLVPVTDRAQEFLVWAIDQQLPGGTESLSAALTRFVGTSHGVQVAVEDWPVDTLSDWFRMGLSVLDVNGREVAWSRTLGELRAQAQGVVARASDQPDSEWLRTDVTRWDFDDLPDSIEVDYADMRINATPVLADKSYRVDLELVPTLEDAPSVHGNGVLRLLHKVASDKVKYLRKNLPDLNRLSLLYMHIGEFDQMFDDLIMASLGALVEQPHLIRSGAHFAQARERCRAGLIAEAQKVSASLLDIMSKRQMVNMTVEEHGARLSDSVRQDIQHQLDSLVYDGFVRATPAEWLQELHRYLQAITLRVRRLVEQGKEPKPPVEFDYHWAKYNAMTAEARRQVPDYRWLLEEWRVSIFAQELGTRKPISAQRVERYLKKHGAS